MYTYTNAVPNKYQTQQGKKGAKVGALNSRFVLQQALLAQHPKGFTLLQFNTVFANLKAGGQLVNASGTAGSYLKALTGKYFTAPQAVQAVAVKVASKK